MAVLRKNGAPRDMQRTRVYAWEGRATKGAHWTGTMKTLEEVAAFMTPIWRAERGRYGRAGHQPPALRSGAGARIARGGAGFLKLPRWSRNPWTICHEMAHELVGGGTGWHAKGGAHGPRFVSCLIGIAARHLGYDAQELMALADEMGVKYDVRSVGSVPVLTASAIVEKAVREEGPMTEMDIACWTDLTYLQVRGAALSLIRKGRARWLRKKLVLIGDAAPKPPEPPKPKRTPPKNKQQQARELAKRIGADIDLTDTTIWVYPPAGLFANDEDDPYHEEGHYCDTWAEALERVKAYEQRKYPGGIAADNPGEA